jgi:ABC-type transport system involved in Fe-S cluster assembly fused permease/ATPase subunit
MIDRGKAAETGRHEDLIKSDGPYRELWTSQNAGN